MKITCPNCGTRDHALVCGDALADRIFEDVWFEIRIVKDKVVIKVQDDAKDYFEQFNKKYFLEEARVTALRGEAECSHCHELVKIQQR